MGAKAKTLVEKWYPIINNLLKTDGFTPPSKVKIVFKKDMKGVAYTSGNTITIAGDWIKKSPNDYGMVVHELTHVIQQYRRTKRTDGWLVEGIADYVRFFKYEPNTKIGRSWFPRQLSQWLPHDREIPGLDREDA